MADQTLAEKLVEYEKLSGSKDVPEAGAGHYIARGVLSGISALADLTPNLYNLGKAAIGTMAGAVGRPDLMPEPGQANPVAAFLHRGYGLDEPVRPSASIGGELGAAVLEGAAGAVGQGPMGLVKAAPLAIAKELGAQGAKFAGLGALAGGGAQVGSEATGGSPFGALAGGILAGVVAPATFLRKGGVTVGAIRSAIQTADDLKARGITAAETKIEPEFTKYVGNTVKGAVAGTPNAAENLTEGIRLREQIPGFNPSVAEMAGSPGLLDMQKKFALLSPKNLNAEVGRTEANIKAVQDFYHGMVPTAESPSSIRSAVNQSLADYEQLLADQAKKVAGKLPVANQTQLGTTLVDAAQAEKTAAKPAIEAAYTRAYKLAPESAIDAKPVIAKIEETLGVPLSKFKPETAPNTFNAIKRFLGGPEQKTPEELAYLSSALGGNIENVGAKAMMTLQEAADLRRAVNADATLAMRSVDPLAATRLRNIGSVKNTIDEAIAGSPITQEAKDAFAAANTKYQTEFAPRFKQGSNLEVFGKTSLNEPKISPDKFISEYFKPDSQAGGTQAASFGRLFGGNIEAKDAAKTGILDIYRQKVVNPTTGAIDQLAHNRFMRDYGRTLNSYRTMGIDAGAEIIKVGKEAAKITAATENLRSLSKSLKFDTVDELANDALKNPKTMGNVLMRLGTEDKRQTFNTILLDKAFESGTATGMRQFLETNQKTLSMSIPKEQLSAMRDITKALEMTERAPIKGNIAAGSADMLKNVSGISTATVFSQIRAVTGQRSSVEWAAINLAMPALNKMTQTSFANVMENALHSPQSAVALRNYLLAESPQQANAWASRLLNIMKSNGKLVWAARGPIISNFLGPERYPGNLAITGTAIRSQTQQAQPAQ